MSNLAYRITFPITAVVLRNNRELMETLDPGGIVIPTSAADHVGMMDATWNGNKVRLFRRDVEERSHPVQVEAANNVMESPTQLHSSVVPEHRSRTRYPIQLNVRFRGVGSDNWLSGVGRAINISSGGILVISAEPVRLGDRIQLSLDWPWRLDGNTPLQLVTEGKVVRLTDGGFAATILRHELKTLRRLSQEPDPISEAVPVTV